MNGEESVVSQVGTSTSAGMTSASGTGVPPAGGSAVTVGSGGGPHVLDDVRPGRGGRRGRHNRGDLRRVVEDPALLRLYGCDRATRHGARGLGAGPGRLARAGLGGILARTRTGGLTGDLT